MPSALRRSSSTERISEPSCSFWLRRCACLRRRLSRRSPHRTERRVREDGPLPVTSGYEPYEIRPTQAIWRRPQKVLMGRVLSVFGKRAMVSGDIGHPASLSGSESHLTPRGLEGDAKNPQAAPSRRHRHRRLQPVDRRGRYARQPCHRAHTLPGSQPLPRLRYFRGVNRRASRFHRAATSGGLTAQDPVAQTLPRVEGHQTRQIE
jgi:hypothetical protein